MEHQYERAYRLYAGGMKMPQLCEIMGIKEGTARTHIKRARSKRSYMVSKGIDPDAVPVGHIPKEVMAWLTKNGKSKVPVGETIRQVLIEAYTGAMK